MKLTLTRDADLAAFRAGIEKQTREQVEREHFQERMAAVADRERVDSDDVGLLRPINLQEGDRLVATDNGYDFYIAGEVEYVGSTTPAGKAIAGDVWVEYTSGGHALRHNDRVLVVVR